MRDQTSGKKFKPFTVALHEECEFPYEHTRPIMPEDSANKSNEILKMAENTVGTRKKMESVMKRDLSEAFWVTKKQWIFCKRKERRLIPQIRDREGV